MAVTSGMPLPADILTIFDNQAAIFKAQWPNIGSNAPSETTTLAAKAQAAIDKILGDGTTTNPGIANSDLQARLQQALRQLPIAFRYDSIFRQCGPTFTAFDNWVASNLPSGWNLNSSDGARAGDLWLRRLNAANSGVPASVVAVTPTLAATTGGAVGQSGVIRVKFTVTSSNGDWLESQPSTGSSTITLTGKNNAITVTISGTAPVSGYVNVYRQIAGSGAGDAYYYDQRVAITSAAAYPAITCVLSDQDLRRDIQPPSWLQCMMLPEAALLYALCYTTQGATVGAQMGLPSLQASGMMNPANVTLNPSYIDASNTLGFLGMGNPPSSGQLAQWIATAFTEGAFPASNVVASRLQGFAGAVTGVSSGGGVRLRTVVVLSANAPITNLIYYWYDATHALDGAVQGPTTIAAPGTLNSAQGSTLDVGIPAGRLVTRVSGFTVGTAVTGTIAAEAIPLRTI